MPFLTPITIDGYYRMGDVGVIALCIVVFILLMTSYVSRTQSFRIFCGIIGLVFFAAIINIGWNELLRYPDIAWKFRHTIYMLRVIYHALLFNVFFLFTLYAAVVSNMKHSKARAIAIFSSIVFIVVVATDILLSIFNTKGSFRIYEDGSTSEGSNVFMIGYVVFIVLLAVIMFRVRKLLVRRVVWGFYLTMALSLFIRFGQFFIDESSLTTMTFALPVVAMLYYLHSTPYNVALGTVDSKAMKEMVRHLYSHKEEFIFMSLLLPDFVGEGKSLPEEVKQQTRVFIVKYFRDGVLFQVGNAQIVMIARKKFNPDFNDWMQTILDAFQEQYNVYHYPYKIVYGESIDEVSQKNEYLSMIESVHKRIPNNVMHRIDKHDFAYFKEDEYIVQELEDIYHKRDLNDPRVLVYCQPVFNIETGRFDTAEALMRLNLDKTGIVFPDQFIHVAEERGFIHVLTEIILNKTCQIINELVNEGYQFKRISVNVSVLELKGVKFCDDIMRILQDNQVPGDKLAIELTESHNEADFLVMKEKIELLREQGIKFYLDDFGTGYSNMERILELPFDIIKFDRSMVIASGTDERSGHIVEKLAKIFSDFKYSVLYEGIEDADDESRCLSMAASYLQGFKYSKPIPIAEIRKFLQSDKLERQ